MLFRSDDHLVVRQGIAGLVGLQPDMVMTGEASNGREAIQQFREHHPDVTLMDLQMPEMNGLEVISSLRKMAWSADIPIVMITASGETAVRYTALELAATDFLQRPFDHIDVKSRLRNLLKLQEAQKKLRIGLRGSRQRSSPLPASS